MIYYLPPEYNQEKFEEACRLLLRMALQAEETLDAPATGTEN
jgi:hypothetical protein